VPSDNPTKLRSKDYVRVETSDEGATSELLQCRRNDPESIWCRIGIKYFACKAKAISHSFCGLQGTRNRYSTGELSASKCIPTTFPEQEPSTSNQSHRQRTRQGSSAFSCDTRELAWLAAASSVKIEIYNSDTQQRYDTVFLTQTGLSEFKRFAKSVLLIRSFLS